MCGIAETDTQWRTKLIQIFGAKSVSRRQKEKKNHVCFFIIIKRKIKMFQIILRWNYFKLEVRLRKNEFVAIALFDEFCKKNGPIFFLYFSNFFYTNFFNYEIENCFSKENWEMENTKRKRFCNFNWSTGIFRKLFFAMRLLWMRSNPLPKWPGDRKSVV